MPDRTPGGRSKRCAIERRLPQLGRVNSSHEFFLLFPKSFDLRVFAISAKTGKRVKIPRCRATVSEELADSHWVMPGKAVCRNRMLPDRRALAAIWTHPHSQARRPAQTVHRKPFACKGGWYACI